MRRAAVYHGCQVPPLAARTTVNTSVIIALAEPGGGAGGESDGIRPMSSYKSCWRCTGRTARVGNTVGLSCVLMADALERERREHKQNWVTGRSEMTRGAGG